MSVNPSPPPSPIQSTILNHSPFFFPLRRAAAHSPPPLPPPHLENPFPGGGAPAAPSPRRPLLHQAPSLPASLPPRGVGRRSGRAVGVDLAVGGPSMAAYGRASRVRAAGDACSHVRWSVRGTRGKRGCAHGARGSRTREEVQTCSRACRRGSCCERQEPSSRTAAAEQRRFASVQARHARRKQVCSSSYALELAGARARRGPACAGHAHGGAALFIFL
jgi:hypothetical protein